MISAQTKKADLELLQASQLTSHHPVRFSSCSNSDACDACNIYGRCSSRADQCSNTFGNMDNPRNSCNSCVGNSHNMPDIHSCTRMRGNRIRRQLARSQPKPEHQLVLPEPAPVRLLLMAVKEVFSLVLLSSLVCWFS